MNELFKNVLFALALCAGLIMTGIPSANAQVITTQCVPSPTILGQGPQGGSSCWGGRQIIGQPFTVNVDGKNMRCSWKDRAATGALYGAAGAAAATAGAYILKLFKQDVSANKAAAAGLLGGAAAGATLMCDPEMVDDGDSSRQTISVRTNIRTYGSQPTVVGGNTCSVLNANGEVLADFLDASKNPKGIVVSSGSECQKARSEFRT